MTGISACGLILQGIIVSGALFANARDIQAESLPLADRPGSALIQASTASKTDVTPPAVAFTDITRDAGIDFEHVNGAYGEKLLPQTMGGGVAFLDYNNDGAQDLLFVNSGYWPGHVPKDAPVPLMALYSNDGSGHFEDVTREAGLDISLYGMGVAAGDFDNDGWVDVYVTAVGENRLFHNEKGRFRDITARSHVAGKPEDWSTAAAFVDYDNDGDLDLFVANYMNWSAELDIAMGNRHRYSRVGSNRSYLLPDYFMGSHPYLFRNDGGVFADDSAASGVQIADSKRGKAVAKALGVAPVDLDRDGWLDFVVANDKVTNFCLHNQGDGTFKEEALMLGLGFDAHGLATSAMGIDAAYYGNDLRLGIAIGNYAYEMDSLFLSGKKSLSFTDMALAEGLGAPTRVPLTFGLFFFDYDLDGRLDILQANGHLEEEIDTVDSSQTYAQSTQLFWNCGQSCAKTFIEVPEPASGDLARPVVGRGASYADIDSDGDLDVVIAQIGGPPLLLRNNQKLGHHWLRVKLIGTRSNRDAIGAWVELVAGGTTQRRQVMPTRSYLSQVELPITFGLGDSTAIDLLRITWPDGTVQELKDVAVDTDMKVLQQK